MKTSVVTWKRNQISSKELMQVTSVETREVLKDKIFISINADTSENVDNFKSLKQERLVNEMKVST